MNLRSGGDDSSGRSPVWIRTENGRSLSRMLAFGSFDSRFLRASFRPMGSPSLKFHLAFTIRPRLVRTLAHMRRLALVLLLSSACATAQPDHVGARNVGQNETVGCC